LYPEIARCDERFDELERLRVICEIPADLNNGGKERSAEWLKVRNGK
jgi:hypothetical protein